MPPKTPSTSRKRKTESEASSSKYNELFLAQKRSVIKDSEEGISLRKLGEKYNIGKCTIQRFAIKNNKDLEYIVNALETYCFNADSGNLPQVF